MSRGNHRAPIRETSFRFFSASPYTKVATETEIGYDYSPPHLVMQAVEQIHLFAGIPYWEAIIITTLTLRVLLLPSAIFTVRDAAKMKALQPEVKKIKESFKDVSAADDPTIRYKYIGEVTKLLARNNVHPVRSMAISSLQIPIFLSLFFGLKNMGTFYPEYCSGGELWFTDLSAKDKYFILPYTNTATLFTMFYLGLRGENEGLSPRVLVLYLF